MIFRRASTSAIGSAPYRSVAIVQVLPLRRCSRARCTWTRSSAVREHVGPGHISLERASAASMGGLPLDLVRSFRVLVSPTSRRCASSSAIPRSVRSKSFRRGRRAGSIHGRGLSIRAGCSDVAATGPRPGEKGQMARAPGRGRPRLRKPGDGGRSRPHGRSPPEPAQLVTTSSWQEGPRNRWRSSTSASSSPRRSCRGAQDPCSHSSRPWRISRRSGSTAWNAARRSGNPAGDLHRRLPRSKDGAILCQRYLNGMQPATRHVLHPFRSPSVAS